MREAGLEFRVLRHGPVGSLAEAAEARGVPPSAVVKTLVVRRGADDYLFVLVPGDRGISWPKLRTLLDVSRLSMPDAGAATNPPPPNCNGVLPQSANPLCARTRLRRPRTRLTGLTPSEVMAVFVGATAHVLADLGIDASST